MTTKPPFSYYGGKAAVAPLIAALLPPHRHYVEPFAGSLAVLLAKEPSMQETVNDLDGDLVTFWRVLRDRPLELERACALTPHSRTELETAKNLDVDDELEHARRVWVILTQSRSHSMKPTGWIYTMAAEARNPAARGKSYSQRIAQAASRIAEVHLENRDALDVIRAYGVNTDTLLYVDPPYLGSTRNSSNYRIEISGNDAHTQLSAALHNCKATVILSGYDSPIYAELYKDWHATKLSGATTLAGGTGKVEVLWSNVPLGVQTLW